MNSIAELFYPVYERYVEDKEDFVANVDRSLSQALIPEPVEMFISKAIGYSLITGGIMWILSLITLYLLNLLGIIPNGPLIGLPLPRNQTLLYLVETLRIPALIITVAIVVGGLTTVITFFAYAKYPSISSNSRAREINVLLPDVLSYMYALSIGGLNQIEIFKAVADAEDTYGEVSKEFNVMLKETEYFETDYRSAIHEHSQRTPSKELEVFLSDMLAILSSGGDLESFLSDQNRKFMRAAKQQQERTLETLELFGEMYMTLSLFPLLLIIVMMTMSIMGEANMTIMYAIVYALIPLLGVGFLVMISTVKGDEVGDGILTIGEQTKEEMMENVFSGSNLADEYSDQIDYDVFDDIKTTEDMGQLKFIVKTPHKFFTRYPTYTLLFTVPLAITFVLTMVLNGAVPLTLDAFMKSSVIGTFVFFYAPIYIVGLPLMIFYELNYRSRHKITGRLSEVLRKLANANDTGQTLLESLKTVSEGSRGKLADELEEMHYKVEYGRTLKEAFVEFNNKYRIPRLARTIKLIIKSQETTEEIGDVLTTAAQVSENQDDIVRERKSRARMQVAIILMTFLALLGVMAILQTQFVTVMADLATGGGGGGESGSSSGSPPGGGGGGGSASFNVNINVNELSMLFFHAVTFQAVLSGLISGYMRRASLMAGLKYMMVLQTISLVTWAIIG